MISCEYLAELSLRVGQAITLPVAFAVIAFSSIAWVYSLELIVQTLHTFKRYDGLYFWSIHVSNIGIILHAIAFNLKWFSDKSDRSWIAFYTALVAIGWSLMVTGQSFVLYSRLHLICNRPKLLHFILAMICINAVLLQPSTSTLNFISNLANSKVKMWKDTFQIMEKVQMTIFSLQECIISILYIIETKRILRPRRVMHPECVNRVMRILLSTNILIVLLDIGMLSTEYAGLYVIEAAIKPAIYALKLKLEFPILNQLTILFKEDSEVTEKAYGSTTQLHHDLGVIGSTRATAMALGPPPKPEIADTFNLDIPKLRDPGMMHAHEVQEYGRLDGIMATTDIRVSNATKTHRDREHEQNRWPKHVNIEGLPLPTKKRW